MQLHGATSWLELLESSFQREYVAAKPIPWVTLGSGKLAGTVRSAGGGGFTAGNVTFATVFEAGCVFFSWDVCYSAQLRRV